MNPIDSLPITGIPWLDAAGKVIGFVGATAWMIAMIAQALLPKTSPTAQTIARVFTDLKDSRAHMGATAEAAAQAKGGTTITSPVPEVKP